MFFYVYVLESKSSSGLYIGLTSNLLKRVKEHNLGWIFPTKSKRPWRIIYCEASVNKLDALRREQYLKTNQGSRLLKRRLKEYLHASRSSTTWLAR